MSENEKFTHIAITFHTKMTESFWTQDLVLVNIIANITAPKAKWLIVKTEKAVRIWPVKRLAARIEVEVLPIGDLIKEVRIV